MTPEQLAGYRLSIGQVQHGFYNIDNRAVPGVDCVWDLEAIPWPLADNSAIAAQAGYIVSRINPARWGFLAFMDEIWRILKPGAELSIVTYYGMCSGFLGDPAACNPVTEVTFYHLDPEHRGGLWQRYQPAPWRLVHLNWACDGNIEAIIAKR